MTNLLLIRHGQSISNLERYFTGSCDIPLTELGMFQARQTAAYIKANYQVDAVYASDLSRAFETGKAVADLYGLTVIPDKNLREIFAGKWERVPFTELEQLFPDTYRVWQTDIGNSQPDGGESVAHLQQRILEAVLRIGAENEGKTVVLATHATPVRALQCHCEGKSLSQMASVPWVTNASVTHIRYEDGKLNLLEAGHDGHLGNLSTSLPSNC